MAIYYCYFFIMTILRVSIAIVFFVVLPVLQESACLETTFLRSSFAYSIWIFLSTCLAPYVFFCVGDTSFGDEKERNCSSLTIVFFVLFDYFFIIPIFIDYDNSYLCGKLANIALLYISIHGPLSMILIMSYANVETDNLLEHFGNNKCVYIFLFFLFLLSFLAWLIIYFIIDSNQNLWQSACSDSNLMRIWIMNLASDLIILILIFACCSIIRDYVVGIVFFCTIIKIANIAGTYSTYRDFPACQSLYGLSEGYLIFYGISFIIFLIPKYIQGLCLKC
jgi:hypothetical protein